LKKTELKERLSQYSIDILNPENFHDKLAPAVMGYADLLFEEFDLDGSVGREHIQTLNLASQLPKEVVFLPEEIKVSLCKLNRGSGEPERIAELINFNKASMYSIIGNSSMRNWNFNDQNIQTNVSEDDHLYFMTEIRINDGNILNLNDSSLNLLEKLKVNKKQGEINLNIKYTLDKRPGFRVIEK